MSFINVSKDLILLNFKSLKAARQVWRVSVCEDEEKMAEDEDVRSLKAVKCQSVISAAPGFQRAGEREQIRAGLLISSSRHHASR